MFDIGFWEMALIALIGLVVLGPERLPTVVRTVARWVARARRYANNLTSELEKELDVEDIRRDVRQAREEIESQAREFRSGYDDFREEAENFRDQAEEGLNSFRDEAEREIEGLRADVEDSVDSLKEPAPADRFADPEDDALPGSDPVETGETGTRADAGDEGVDEDVKEDAGAVIVDAPKDEQSETRR